jgi:hypothetical protein
MTLEKTEVRCNALLVAHEGRLSVDNEGVYWLASDEGGAPRAAQPAFADAVEELFADGDLEKGTEDAGSTPVTTTEDGEALFASWGTPQ